MEYVVAPDSYMDKFLENFGLDRIPEDAYAEAAAEDILEGIDLGSESETQNEAETEEVEAEAEELQEENGENEGVANEEEGEAREEERLEGAEGE